MIEALNALMRALDGKKTHICAVAYGVLATYRLVSDSEVEINVDEVFDLIMELLKSATIICLRLGFNKRS